MKLSRILPAALVAATLSAPLAAYAAPTAAPAAPAADGTVLTYTMKQGTVSLLTIGDKTKLAGAPSSFRQFAKASMREEWRGYFKGRPACKGVPNITVSALRTDGFAFGSAGDSPQPGCQAGGGYEAFWAIRKGEWKQVIGTQDVPNCSRLEKLDFPSLPGVDQCYDGEDVVTYTHD